MHVALLLHWVPSHEAMTRIQFHGVVLHLLNYLEHVMFFLRARYIAMHIMLHQTLVKFMSPSLRVQDIKYPWLVFNKLYLPEHFSAVWAVEYVIMGCLV